MEGIAGKVLNEEGYVKLLYEYALLKGNIENEISGIVYNVAR